MFEPELYLHCTIGMSFVMGTIYSSWLWTLWGVTWSLASLYMANKGSNLAIKYKLPATLAKVLAWDYMHSMDWLDNKLESLKKKFPDEQRDLYLKVIRDQLVSN